MSGIIANNKTIATIMMIVGVVCFLLAFFVIFLYKKKLNNEKSSKEEFGMKIMATKYKIFHFWGHTIYIFLTFTFFIASIILVTIAMGSLLN